MVTSFLCVPTRAASTPRRSSGSTAWRPALSKISSPPTHHRTLVCLNAWGGLCAPWFGTCSQTEASHRPCGGSCSGRPRISRTGLRRRRSRGRRHSRCFTARKPTSCTFASSESEPSCTSRTPESSTPRTGKRRCAAIARRATFTESGTQEIAPLWRAETSPSSRHHRTCFTRLESSLRCKIWYHRCGMSTTTVWTTTTLHTTAYCGI